MDISWSRFTNVLKPYIWYWLQIYTHSYVCYSENIKQTRFVDRHLLTVTAPISFQLEFTRGKRVKHSLAHVIMSTPSQLKEFYTQSQVDFFLVAVYFFQGVDIMTWAHSFLQKSKSAGYPVSNRSRKCQKLHELFVNSSWYLNYV